MRSGLIAIAGGVVLLFIAARGPDGPIVVPPEPPDPRGASRTQTHWPRLSWPGPSMSLQSHYGESDTR